MTKHYMQISAGSGRWSWMAGLFSSICTPFPWLLILPPLDALPSWLLLLLRS